MHPLPLTCRRPPPLQIGDEVALVAPAGGYAAGPRAAGCQWLQSKGLRVFEEEAAEPYFALAGTLAQRTRSLRRALQRGAPCVWPVRAGSGAGRVVAQGGDEWDQALTRAPTWVVGFSDITALHARAQAAGLMSLHAANITTLASWSEQAREELWQCLTASELTQTFSGQPTRRAWNAATHATGPLVGGNLTVLASLVGCNVLPSFAGAIVLLEDIDERPYRLARSLGQLIDSHALSGIAGVALGQLTRCEDTQADYNALSWMLETLSSLEVPIVTDLPLGHDSDSRPVVLGGLATLCADTGQLEVCS